MPVLDASTLTTDPEGLAFLRDVLETGAETAAPGRRFPVEAWTPKLSLGRDLEQAARAAQARDHFEPRCVEPAM